MLQLLRKDSLQIFWIIFHVALGGLSVNSKWPLIFWYYLIIFSAGVQFFTRKNLEHLMIYLLGYSLAVEVMARAIGATPFIPDQIGKYLGVVGFAFGLALGGPIKRVSIYGVIMLILSVPALIVAPYDSYKPVVYNYFGLLALILGVIYCSRQIMTFKNFKELGRIIVYPIISLAVFTFFKAAQIEKIDYGLTANYDSGGGRFTNQVSTLFGLAIGILALAYITRQLLFKHKVIDVLMLMLFLTRGLLTFSRGGMLAAILAIFIIILFPKARAAWQDNETVLRKFSAGPVFAAILIISIVFLAINSYTDNFLLYRYQGKTERSLQTGFDRSADIDQISSGRYSIMMSDLRMFIAYPALGVGVGYSKIERVNHGGGEGLNAHIEISRLLAEHGLPGLVLVIMIFFYPFFKAYNEPNNYRKSIMLLFLIMGLASTFHSAMRTMITPLLFAFAFINFVPTNYDWKPLLMNKKRRLQHQRNLQAEVPSRNTGNNQHQPSVVP
ncbi:MAG: O-antigen ligase family protein [Chitinophagaceae bacterium]|nr:O-antigen ligase family protein [Chitinophagaceae bacterium]